MEHHRTEASTKASFPTKEQNLGSIERAISFLGGTYFTYKGIKKRSLWKSALGGFLFYRAASGYCAASQFFGRTSVIKNENVNSRVSIVIEKPRPVVFQFWKKFENFPLFMKHIQEVQILEENTVAWKAAGVGRLPGVVWISKIVEEEENKMIGWNTLEGSDISLAGKVVFDQISEAATEVNIIISYRPEYGMAGEFVAHWLNSTVEQMIAEDLNNFKNYLEMESMIAEKVGVSSGPMEEPVPDNSSGSVVH